MNAPAPTGGDRDSRRRDVLKAAARLLADREWNDFSMRDVARVAGVSPGAVYLWFAGKGDIVSGLHREELRRAAELINALPVTVEPDQLVTDVVRALSGVYVRVGRHRHRWSRDAAADSTLSRELRGAVEDLTRLIDTRLEVAALHSGRRLRENSSRVAFLSAVAAGVGDQLADMAAAGLVPSNDELVMFASDAATRGLFDP